MHYGDDLKEILYGHFEKLYDLNFTILKWLTHHMSAPAQLTESIQFEKIPAPRVDDIRNSIRPENAVSLPHYSQVFMDRRGYMSNLSALDLLMHVGPESYNYLRELP